ncbi:hypothetical protein CMEL01_10630 [Colletotrichum melonis]|uniref:Uncharacterized protein n=1 Tax=Colletotrichum melonis TaxID=1209925 RepID=A0AAI9TXA9_9PEZI|nr:hypothetical protein CMEL01_10630 [Colletotrichum melonis]
MAWLSPSLICIPPLPSIFLCFPLLSFLLYLLPRSSSSPSPLSIAVLSSSCKFWVYSSEQSASVLGTCKERNLTHCAIKRLRTSSQSQGTTTLATKMQKC